MSDFLLDTIGNRIRKRRIELNLTQEELGQRLGWGKSAVCRLEKITTNITTDKINKIANALECSPLLLMGWNNDISSTIGSRIKTRRKELGLTQSELAERVGCKSKVSISHVESNRDDITITRLNVYADALNVPLSYLLGISDSDYSTEEKILMENYRKLSDTQKEIVKQLMSEFK